MRPRQCVPYRIVERILHPRLRMRATLTAEDRAHARRQWTPSPVRPETAPLSPAWNGSRTTVARGLRLICNGALDGANANVGELAGRLGIGERHLVRLFTKHLGASPGQVGKTLRVQRVKRLLDTTNPPMLEVALATDFSSLRRYNAVVF
jgi:transcriptional regulator GlxA family with amidase domain